MFKNKFDLRQKNKFPSENDHPSLLFPSFPTTPPSPSLLSEEAWVISDWLTRGCACLQEDTEHQGGEGQQGHGEAEVGHAVLPLGLGQAVGQSCLQAHEQHAGGEGHARAHIMEHLGTVHLGRGGGGRRKGKERCWSVVRQH